MFKGFTYFLPGHARPTVDRKDFEAAGLAHALSDDGGNPDAKPVEQGPDGGAGTLAAVGLPAGEMPQYDPAWQEWRKGPGGRFWVGVSKDARPGPADLVRTKPYEGATVRLADGSDWVVPVCHVPAFLRDRRPSLPMMIGLADDGETAVMRPHPRYVDLCGRAQRLWIQFCGMATENDQLDGAQQLRLAADALAVNYRIGFVEAVGALGLFGEDELMAVLRSLIDADATDAWGEAQPAEGSTGPKE